jgi:hypothetical protein
MLRHSIAKAQTQKPIITVFDITLLDREARIHNGKPKRYHNSTIPTPKPIQMEAQINPRSSAFTLVPELGATLLTTPVAPPPVAEQMAPQAKFGGQHPPPTPLSQLLHPPAGQGPLLKVLTATPAPVTIAVVT